VYRTVPDTNARKGPSLSAGADRRLCATAWWMGAARIQPHTEPVLSMSTPRATRSIAPAATASKLTADSSARLEGLGILEGAGGHCSHAALPNGTLDVATPDARRLSTCAAAVAQSGPSRARFEGQNAMTSRPRTPPSSRRRCASAARSLAMTSATRSVKWPSSTWRRSPSSLSRERE